MVTYWGHELETAEISASMNMAVQLYNPPKMGIALANFKYHLFSTIPGMMILDLGLYLLPIFRCLLRHQSIRIPCAGGFIARNDGPAPGSSLFNLLKMARSK